MRFLAEEVSRDTYVNIMDQYHPAAKALRHPQLNRPVMYSEVDEAMHLALGSGLFAACLPWADDGKETIRIIGARQASRKERTAYG